MTETAKLLCGILLIVLVSVMYGGYSLLSLARARKLDEQQIVLFRAGHAHAGVLTILNVVVVTVLDAAGVSSNLLYLVAIALLVGTLGQAGGFFVRLLPTERGPKLGTLVTSLGAVVLAATVIGAAIALFVAM